MLDTPEENFSVHYDKCKEFIDEGRASGVVLVHWLVHAYWCCVVWKQNTFRLCVGASPERGI